MKSLWNETDALAYMDDPLQMRIYTSRLLGSDSSLVLHGGGNTSVKLSMKNILGEEQDVLFVKGSGIDLSIVDSQGFASLELSYLREFRNLESLTDEEMDNQLRTRKLTATAPDPSVETLLHAFLPHKYIDHTHADSILVLTNQKNGSDLVREALGEKVATVPYVMPGLPLAKTIVEAYEQNPEIEAIVSLNHGIFTFGESAKTSYLKMIEYVDRAETYINRKIESAGTDNSVTTAQDISEKAPIFAQAIRGACAYHHGPEDKLRRFHTEIRSDSEMVRLSQSDSARKICSSGVITPDHVTRMKNKIVYVDRIPEDDEDLCTTIKELVESFTADYDEYFHDQLDAKKVERQKLDPLPRAFLIAGIGLISIGTTRKAARIVSDIAEHNIRVKDLANSVGDYVPISAEHIFDVEYWSLQQKKLGDAVEPILQGQIALVTGAGGAIGFGIADQLMANGATVVITDIDEAGLQKVHSILAERYHESQVESIVFDVTDYNAVEKSFGEISRRLGGIDIVVPNAGLAHVAKIEDLEPEKFSQVVSVNLMGTFNVIKASIPVFRRQGTGGNIVLISSKNVPDPGAAFGAYSASKAAAHQISKIAALELAELGVRVNMVNPDGVFGDEDVSSKLWDLVGPDRMKSRGLDPDGLKDYYRQRNLLKISVQAKHVGNAVVFFASEQTPTTGATLPVDGGVPAAFPR